MQALFFCYAKVLSRVSYDSALVAPRVNAHIYTSESMCNHLNAIKNRVVVSTEEI